MLRKRGAIGGSSLGRVPSADGIRGSIFTMDRRTFIQGTTTAALTASALPQIASASPSEFVVGGIPAHVVASILRNFGEGGFTCLPTDSRQTAEIGLIVFRNEMQGGERVQRVQDFAWPIFDVAFEPRYEGVSLAVLAERMAEASPDDPTVAVFENPHERKLGLIRYDLQGHVAHVTTAKLVDGGREIDREARALLTDRRLQIHAAWRTRLAQRDAEAEQLTRENPWTVPGDSTGTFVDRLFERCRSPRPLDE